MISWIKTSDRKPPVDVPVLAYCGAHQIRCVYPSSCQWRCGEAQQMVARASSVCSRDVYRGCQGCQG